MTTDISRIRQSLKEYEEVTLPYKLPYKCWIKYIHNICYLFLYLCLFFFIYIYING